MNTTTHPLTSIVWNAAAESLPDDEECVLIALLDGEVWTGFVDGEVWRFVSADPISDAPTHWAHFPEPPGTAR